MGPRVLYIRSWSRGNGAGLEASRADASSVPPVLYLPGLIQPSATRSKQCKDGSQRSADQLSYLQCSRSVAASTFYCPPTAPPAVLSLPVPAWEGLAPGPAVAPRCPSCPYLCSLCAAALFGEAAPQVKSDRLRGLLDRQQALQETLRLKLQELRKVCLQEAVRAWPQGCHAGRDEGLGHLGRQTAVMGA